MHFDPILLQVVGATLVILAAALATRLLEQPHVIGYLLAGVLLGPSGLSFFTEYSSVARLGDLGVVFLLFFVGMETSPHKLLENWRITFLGSLVQIGGSVLAIWVVSSLFLDWPLSRVILMGFVISLSSTAVVLNYLNDTGQLKAKIGQDALGILLAQDLALIPMLIVIGLLGGNEPDLRVLTLQGIGATLIMGLLVWMTVGKHVRLPLGQRLKADHELQLFTAFGLCLGLSLLTGLFQLSTALGAFVAGMLVGVARETNWVHRRLEPFRIVFVAIFFVSIGLLVDTGFILANIGLVLGLVLVVFVGNTFIVALIFRLLGDRWHYSIFAGAHLAQIGEFSFVLAAVGMQVALISQFAYQLTIAVIAISLLLSPAWIKLVGTLQGRARPGATPAATP